jgi:hypothetical protein
MKITRTELKKIIKEVISELELFEGLTKAQEKLPEPLKKAILKKQKNETDSDDSSDDDEKIEEGNAFGAAVKAARENNENEFEVGGKKYKLKEKKEITEQEDTEEFVGEEESDAESDEDVEEGNAFGAAVTKAKEDGDDEFEVDGKSYKVKESNEDDSKIEIAGKTYTISNDWSKLTLSERLSRIAGTRKVL